MPQKSSRRRSVLFVPASNARALAKVATLSPDAVIFDLEDAVTPDDKTAAREGLSALFAARPQQCPEWAIRINPLDGEWGMQDLAAACACGADAILVPKIETPRDIHDVDDALDEAAAPPELRLWAMIETPKAMLNLGGLAELGRDKAARLDCLVAGTNDLVGATGVLATPDRRHLKPWLMQIVLAGRAGGFDVLDGVFNDFKDAEGFWRECEESAAMGFDGKTLIHPSQIEAATRAYSPSPERVAEARAVISAFSRPENVGRSVVSSNGRMLERLHLAEAERLLARAEPD